MRWWILILCLISLGCVSHGYDSESRYYDNGVGYDPYYEYGATRSTYGAGVYYYESSWPYHSHPSRGRIDYHRGYDDRDRYDGRDRNRDSDRNRDDRSVRYPQERAMDRNDRPIERVDPHQRRPDSAADIERNREIERRRTRDQQRAEPERRTAPQPARDPRADESRRDARPQPKPEIKPPPASESKPQAPRGDRNVRDVQQGRQGEASQTPDHRSESAGERVRRR